LGAKKYNIIYADPPWNFNFHKRNLSQEALLNLYPTMKADEILNLPVGDIADSNCALFLWVMNSEIPLALNCIERWGFAYKTVAFVWVKTTASGGYHFGGGNWTRSGSELCLLATKGKVKRVSASVSEIIDSLIGKHSKKPDIVRDKIVELCGDLPRVELFARGTKDRDLFGYNKFDGWDLFGNQVENSIDLKNSAQKKNSEALKQSTTPKVLNP